MVETVRRYRFTMEDYHEMGRAGIFPEDARLELIDGEILVMSPQGERHAACVDRLTALFGRLGPRAIVRVGGPVGIGDRSETLPDLQLLAPRENFYADRLVRPGDNLLLVEVADSSLPYDRGEKLALYAEGGICEYWIVNLRSDVIEVHLPVSEGSYELVRMVDRSGTLSPTAFPDFTVRADEILP
jgi:Uma2 family endonuclease